MDILRGNGLLDPFPKYILYWPEKQLHRYITCRKEAEAPENDGTTRTQLLANMTDWVNAEESEAERLHDRLDQLCDTLIGTDECPKRWAPIPEIAHRLWDSEAYLRYQAIHYHYHLRLHPSQRTRIHRKDMGKRLLLIEERQRLRIQRIGYQNLLRREYFGDILSRLIGQEGELPPSNDVISEAWAKYEEDGFYIYQSPNGAEDRTIKLPKDLDNEDRPNRATKPSQINHTTIYPSPLN